MAILQILKYPDETLTKVSKQVTDFDARLHQLLDDMRETMAKAGGMGLAGVQVGRILRICLVHTKEGIVELINPEIIFRNKVKRGDEGCLSIPNENYKIKRHHIITVAAKDRHGKEFTKDFHGIEAVCVQHEMDHMDGVMINSETKHHS